MSVKKISRTVETKLLDIIGYIMNVQEVKRYTPNPVEVADAYGWHIATVESYFRKLQSLNMIEKLERFSKETNKIVFKITDFGEKCLEENKIIIN